MSGNLERDIAEVKQYLSSQYMNTVDVWLTGCVDYLYNNGNRKQYSINEIKSLTRGQWLLNDLTVICPGSLPSGLNQTPRTVLNGKFVLQINCLIDIGCPAFQQLQKLKKINEENIEATVQREDKIASHRMIKMDLTDGVQDITAIEYRPMRNLTCELPPGTKILIKGPVECSIGTLLLEEKHVEVLGGEVDSLVENNTILQLLNRMVYGQIEGPTSNSTIESGPPNQNNPLGQIFPRAAPTNNSNGRTTRPSRTQAMTDPDRIMLSDNFHEDDINIDIDQLAAIEQQALDAASLNTRHFPTTAKHPIDVRSPDSFGAEQNSNARKKIKFDTNSFGNKIEQNNVNDYPFDEDDLIANEDLEAQLLAEMDAKLAQPTLNMYNSRINNSIAVNSELKRNTELNCPIKVSLAPFCYIKQINDAIEINQGRGKKFVIKAQILSIRSKLLIINKCWSLKCTLIDGSGKLDADFTSDTLTKLVGHSPTDMGRMKKQFETNPDLKLKATLAITSAKEKIQVLNCLVEITIKDTPEITQLIEYKDEHLIQLKKRSSVYR